MVQVRDISHSIWKCQEVIYVLICLCLQYSDFQKSRKVPDASMWADVMISSCCLYQKNVEAKDSFEEEEEVENNAPWQLDNPYL